MFTIRQSLAPSNRVNGVPVPVSVLQSLVGEEQVQSALSDCGLVTPRERKLNFSLIVWLMLGAGLWSDLALPEVFDLITAALWQEETEDDAGRVRRLCANSGALSYRRKQVGAAPFHHLFHQVCRPMARESASSDSGSFLFGRRLLAIDGQRLSLADTPENEKVFGRPGSRRGTAAFPQAQAVYLCECGTHAIIDAGLWPCRTSELVGCKRVLRSVGPGDLVTWDRGFYGVPLIQALRQRGADLLVRVPDHVKPTPVETLPDGTQLVWVTSTDKQSAMFLRLISYTVETAETPSKPSTADKDKKDKKVTRLLTNLLSHERYPATELAQAYHERWEIELAADEIETHQRGPAHDTLRSKKPLLVVQEFFALLTAHYAVRKVMHEAAQKHERDPDRMSFVHTLRILAQSVPYFHLTPPYRWPALYQNLLDDIAHYALPPRRLRNNPRAVKKKMSNFPVKRRTDTKATSSKMSYKQTITLCPTLI